MAYTDILRELGVEHELRGPWAVVGRAGPAQGWKLHISSVPSQAEKLLGVLVPLFHEGRISFKIARDELTLSMLNEGALGPTQIGKFVTIYPETDAKSRELADELIGITKGFAGPVVMTDLRLGSVVYARYGGFNPDNRRDRLGHNYAVLHRPDGSVRPDEYSVPFVSPAGVPNPFADVEAQRASDNRPANAGKLFGPGYLLLRVIKPNPKGSVFLALDLQRRSQVALKIIKEGRQHCMSDSYGRDVRDRLRHQWLLHPLLAGRVPIPAAESYFELSGNAYLVLEHVDGHDLGSNLSEPYATLPPVERRRLLATLPKLVEAVGALHEAGYVHRDLAPTNVRVRQDGSVCLLDLELACAIGSAEPPFGQGTPGFMSPQQQSGEPPAVADDVYSIGALMVLLLTGLDPRRVLFADDDARIDQLHELTGAPDELVETVAQCVATRADARPPLTSVRRVLESLQGTIAQPGVTCDVRQRQAVDSSAGCARGLLYDTLVDGETGMWLSPVVARSGMHQPETGLGYALHRSTSRGVAGVVYTLARFAQCGFATSDTRPRVERAIDWLLAHAPTADDQLPGLHFGEAGVAVAIAEAVRAHLIDRGAWLHSYLDEALHGPLDWPDLTHGAAGQGLAALIISDLSGDAELAVAARRCAAYLIDSQDADGGWTLPEGVEAMKGARYTGFAHGVAGEVYFLMEYATRFQDDDADRSARLGAEWLIERAIVSDGSAHWPMKEGDDERWVWWCHGAPGIALAMLKLFEHTRETRYADVARQALAAHPHELRYSNLSQCHGLSGLGEIYLEAARVLLDDRFLARAERIGRLLLQLARKDHGLTWLVEDPYKATGDLMIGCGGVAHLLLRLSGAAPDLGPPLLPAGLAARQNRGRQPA